MTYDHDTREAPEDFDRESTRARIAHRIGGTPPDGDRRRRRATTTSLGVLGVGALALAVGITAAGAGGGPAPLAQPPTTSEAPPAERTTDEPRSIVSQPRGHVEIVPAAVLLPMSVAAVDASPDAISQVTTRTSSYSDDDLVSVVELRSTVAADGSWTLLERLRDLGQADGEPLDDAAHGPDAPGVGAWGTYQQPDGTWTSISVDRTLGIWSTSSSPTDPNPTVSRSVVDAQGTETVVEEPTNIALSSARGYRDLAETIHSGEHGYQVVEGSEQVQTIDGVDAVCVDYVVDESWHETEFDRHGQLCVDPGSGLPRKVVDVYSKGGPDRPEGYASAEVSTYSEEKVFGWFESSSENERLFDISLEGLTEVTPEAFEGRTSLFATY